MSDGLNNRISQRRKVLGFTQEQLAHRVGVTRQTLSSVESGRSAPSTAVSLRLSRELSCRVEDLFWVDEDGTGLDAHLAKGAADLIPGDIPIALGRVGQRWVAHGLTQNELSVSYVVPDGLFLGPNSGSVTTKVETWERLDVLSEQVLIAGCAPPLGLLEKQTSGLTRGRVRWLSRPSLTALEHLVRGEVHVAGIHILGGDDEYNLELVRRTFPADSVRVITLAHWSVGLVVAPGNPLGIRGMDDLHRADLRVANRDPQSGAHLVWTRECERVGIDPKTMTSTLIAGSHMEVANAVLYGMADIGITIEAVAHGLGLDFIPLARERFDLVYPTTLEEDFLPALDTLSSGRFRRTLKSVGYYDVTHTNDQAAL